MRFSKSYEKDNWDIIVHLKAYKTIKNAGRFQTLFIWYILFHYLHKFVIYVSLSIWKQNSVIVSIYIISYFSPFSSYIL